MPGTTIRRLCFILGFLLAAAAGCAQDVTLTTVLDLYGDNTEFTGPYRKGDTIFGGRLASALDFRFSDRLSMRVGAWGARRHGSDEFFDETLPLLSATLSSGNSSIIVGSHFPEKRHGFLDALQDPRLEFTRPMESGFQWTDEGPRHRSQLYLNWQRYATAARREIFDSGFLTRAAVSDSLDLDLQIHSWHRGGQIAETGTVINNNAAALGVVYAPRTMAAWRVTLSLHALGSKATKEPEFPLRRTKGHGILGRLEAWPWTRAGFFAQVWEALDFFSFEGDPNYNSQGLEPGDYEPKRSYAEVGVKWAWSPAGEARFEGQLALHVVDHSEITPSLRLSLRVPVVVPLGRVPAGADGKVSGE